MTARILFALFVTIAVSACATHSVRRPASADIVSDDPGLKKTQADFDAYVAGYTVPELFSENEAALEARLKLVDQVPAGGQIKVMTFVHDNGHATKLLGAHLCLAVKRGAKVQYFPDSKSGDRPGIDDAFDFDPQNRVNEELYQMLVNCGAEVRIHNHIEPFDISVFKGTPIPSIPKSRTSTVYGLFSSRAERARQLLSLGSAFVSLINEHFEEAGGVDGVKKNTDKDLIAMKKYFKGVLISFAKAYWDDPSTERLLDEVEKIMEKANNEAIPKWTQSKTPALRKFVYELLYKIQKHEKLGLFYAESRKFNRLNHRKLFHVSSGGRTCMFVGGRNLGDHYLTWGHHDDEFMDTDVLVCDHHTGTNRNGENALTQAAASFNDLWNNSDLEDPVNMPPEITIIKPDYKYQFSYLKFPKAAPGQKDWSWVFSPYDSQTGTWVNASIFTSRAKREGLKDDDRMLIPLTQWPDVAPVRGVEINGATNWRLVTSTWNKEKDKVRQQLYSAINNEQEHIYIETAYSEMNSVFKKHLQDALARGIKVEVVTNSIFVADGGSKAIRLMMARWFRQMWEKYPKTFNVKYANIDFGHMIHVKGASFACQKAPNSQRAYRLNIVGSHNFHGRSGYSDKEHAIVWEQNPHAECLQKTGDTRTVASNDKDFRELRNDFYENLTAEMKKKNVAAPLVVYKSLDAEITDALNSGRLSDDRRKVAEKLRKILYHMKTNEDGTVQVELGPDGLGKLRAKEQVFFMLEFLSDIGLSDIFGALL